MIFQQASSSLYYYLAKCELSWFQTTLHCETMRRCQGDKGIFLMSLSFAAGQAALYSGVYKAIHANNHLPSHFVIALHGEIFPN